MKRFLLVILLVAFCFCFTSFASAAPKSLKIAMVFSTPLEEPWASVVHKALLKAQKELSVTYHFTENVNPSDYERVLREYSERGYDIIFIDAYGNEEASRRVAKDYPEIPFVGGSGLAPTEPNFSVFQSEIHEPLFLSGMIAGKITKTNILGAVAAIPVPDINRAVNAFRAGAREVNPNVVVKVTFVGSFFDPPKTKEAAIAQIEAGADILFAERYGVIDACEKKGVFAIGNYQDQNFLAPKTVLTSAEWDMWPTVKKVIEDVRAKQYRSMDYSPWSFMAKGGAHLAPFHGLKGSIPDEVKQLVKEKEKEIMEGNFKVPYDSTQPKTD